MQPYQQASEQIKNQQAAPGNALSNAAATGVGLALGGSLLTRIVPLLSKLIPSSLAVKGLSKIDARFGKFINGFIDKGGTQDEALNFIRDKVEKATPKQEAFKKYKEHTNKKSMMQQEQERFTQGYPSTPQDAQSPQIQGQQPTQGANPGDEMILAALQKILQM